MDRGAWQPTVHGVAKNWTGLSAFHFQISFILLFLAVLVFIAVRAFVSLWQVGATL